MWNKRLIEKLDLQGVARQFISYCDLIDVRISPAGDATYNFTLDPRAAALNTDTVRKRIEDALSRTIGMPTAIKIVDVKTIEFVPDDVTLN